MAILTTSLEPGTINQFYATALSGTGGTTPYTWGLKAGSPPLPSGLTLSNNGVISGTPTVTSNATHTFTLTDATSLTVEKPLQLSSMQYLCRSRRARHSHKERRTKAIARIGSYRGHGRLYMGTHRRIVGPTDWIDTEYIKWIDKRHPDRHEQSTLYIHRHGSNPAHTANSDQDIAIDYRRRTA